MKAFTFEYLLTNPTRLAEVLRGDPQVICLAGKGSVMDPKEIVIGSKAAREVKITLENKLVEPLHQKLAELKKSLADDFSKLNSSADLQLFVGLPLTCYPVDHVFRSNGSWAILEKYQALAYWNNLQTTLTVDCPEKGKTQVVLLGQSNTRNVEFDPDRQDGSFTYLSIFYSTKATAYQYLNHHYPTGDSYAVDHKSNLWIRTDVLRQILLG